MYNANVPQSLQYRLDSHRPGAVHHLVLNRPVAGLRRARSAARARFPTAMITIALPLGLRQIVIVGGNSWSMEDLVRTVVEAAQKNELAAGSTYRANSL